MPVIVYITKCISLKKVAAIAAKTVKVHIFIVFVTLKLTFCCISLIFPSLGNVLVVTPDPLNDIARQ